VVAVTTDDARISASVVQQLHLDYPILTDRAGGLGSAFGVYQAAGHMGSTDEHSMFVIDSAGFVRWGQVSPSMHVLMSDVLSAVQAAT
jgi:peroxiredoxin